MVGFLQEVTSLSLVYKYSIYNVCKSAVLQFTLLTPLPILSLSLNYGGLLTQASLFALK